MFEAVSTIQKKYSFWKHQALEQVRSELLEQNGLLALSDVVEFLSNEGIKHWVDAGTLLGIVRDGSFIDGDTDIDIGVSCVVNRERFVSNIKRAGFTVCYGYSYQSGDLALLRVEKRSVGIDIEFFVKEGSVYYYDSPREYAGSREVPTPFAHSVLRYFYEPSCLDTLDQLSFNGVSLMVPRKLDQYFSTYYRDWKQKVQKRKYLDGYFGVSVDLYEHHNNRALYEPDELLYFSAYEPSTIKICQFDFICFLFRAKVWRASMALEF